MSIFTKMFSWLSTLWNILFRRNVIDKTPKSRENSKDCVISTEGVGDRGETADGSFVDIPLSNTIILVDKPAERPPRNLNDLGDPEHGAGNSNSYYAEFLTGKKESVPEIHTRSERAFGSHKAQVTTTLELDVLQATESVETVYSSSNLEDCDLTTFPNPNEEIKLLRPDSCLFKFEEECSTEDDQIGVSGTKVSDVSSLENGFEETECTRADPTIISSFDIGDVLTTSQPADDEPVMGFVSDFVVDDVSSKDGVENSLVTPIESLVVSHVSSSNDTYKPSSESKHLSIPFVEGIDRELGFEIDESGVSIIDRMITQCDQVFSILSTSSISVQEKPLDDSARGYSFGDDATVPEQDILIKGDPEWDSIATGQDTATDHAIYVEYETNKTTPINVEGLPEPNEAIESDEGTTLKHDSFPLRDDCASNGFVGNVNDNNSCKEFEYTPELEKFSILSTFSSSEQEEQLDDCSHAYSFGNDATVPDADPDQDIILIKDNSESDTKATDQATVADHEVYVELETNKTSLSDRETSPEPNETIESDYEGTTLKHDAFDLRDDSPSEHTEHENNVNDNNSYIEFEYIPEFDKSNESAELCDTQAVSSYDPFDVDAYLDIDSDAEFIKKILIEKHILLNMNLQNVGLENLVDTSNPHFDHLVALKEDVNICSEFPFSTAADSPVREAAKAEVMEDSLEYSDSVLDNKIVESVAESVNYQENHGTSSPAQNGNTNFSSHSVSSSNVNSPSLSFDDPPIEDPGAGVCSTKYTPIAKFSHEYSTNYSIRSDSLINFLRDPLDDQLETDCLGCGTTNSGCRVNANSKAETDEKPVDYSEKDGTLISSQSLERTKCMVDVTEIDTNLKINESIHERDLSDEPLATEVILVAKSNGNISTDIVKLSESFGNLTIHSSSGEENSLEGVMCEETIISSRANIEPTDRASEILEPSGDPGNMTTHSLFSDQDSSLGRPFFQSTSIENNFKCFSENSSTPIAKAINEGFIAENPCFTELSFFANAAPDQEQISLNSSIACIGGHITYEEIINCGEKEYHQPIQPKRRSYLSNNLDESSEFEEETDSGLQVTGILDRRLISDPHADVLRSIASAVEKEFDGLSLGYKTEYETSSNQANLSLGGTGSLQQYDKNVHWKTPGSVSLPSETNALPNAYNCDSIYFSGTHDYFGNVIWPPSPVPPYGSFNLDSSEHERSNLEGCQRTEHQSNLQDSLDLYPFINGNPDSPTNIVQDSSGEESIYQCVEPPVQMNWPTMNDDANAESESRPNEFYGQQADDSFGKVGTIYFVQNSPASTYETPPPILNQIGFQAIHGMVREAEALRRDFSLSGDLDRSNRWAETAAPFTQVAIPTSIAPSNFPGNFGPSGQHPALQVVSFPVDNSCSQNYFEILEPFGTTVFSAPNHPPLMYNSVFSLPIPIPPVALPLPPMHMDQNVTRFENVDEDYKRFQVANRRQTLDSDTDQFRVTLPAVDTDSVDLSHPHEPGLFDDVEDEFSFFPRSTLSKNDSLLTLRSKYDSFNGSLLGESLRSVFSSLNKDDAIRPSMSNERRKYSEPSLISNLKSLSHDSLPTAVADDGFSGGGDDNYSAKVRFLNELNLALNESLVDDELNNITALMPRFGEVLGETMTETKHESVAVRTNCCISSPHYKDFCLNGKDIALKVKPSFIQSDYDRSHCVVESILAGILDEIQTVRESDTQFSFSLGEETIPDGRRSFGLENIVRTTNSDEMVQRQMMVLVKHDFEDCRSWKDINEKLKLPDDKPALSELQILQVHDSPQFDNSMLTHLEPSAARVTGVDIESVENVDGKCLDIVKLPQSSDDQVKRGRRRKRKTSAIKLLAEKNIILEESEKNFGISDCIKPIRLSSKASTKSEESSSDLGFSLKEMVSAESPGVMNNNPEVPDGALDSSKGKKRNRRRKKRTN